MNMGLAQRQLLYAALAITLLAAGPAAGHLLEPTPEPHGTSTDASVYGRSAEEVVDEGNDEDGVPQYVVGVNEPPSTVKESLPEEEPKLAEERQRLARVMNDMLDKELSSKGEEGCGKDKTVKFKDVKRTIEKSDVPPSIPQKTDDQVEADYRRIVNMYTESPAGKEERCAQHGDCTTCTGLHPNAKGCGWCSSTKACLPGTVDGPFGRHNCTAWDFTFCSGEPCSVYLNCYQCAQDPFCGWCGELYQCVEGTSAGPLFGACKQWDAFVSAPGASCGIAREAFPEHNLADKWDPQGEIEYSDIRAS